MRDPSLNPYVGARPFERKDGPYFFGRDEEARQLTSLVIAHRVALFYAPSGAGKTSLLKARVIPELEERRRVRVLPVSRVGGDLPRDLDGSQVANIYVFNALVSLAGEAARPAELAGLGLAEGLRPYLEQAPDEQRLRPRLLILDQFEELFTTHPDRSEDRADFFLQVQQCLDAYAQLSLLISMREDYIANLDFYAAQLPDRLRTRFRMELLSRDGALAAVKEPARAAGCPFADDVAEVLVDNLRRIQPGRRSAEEGGRPAILGETVEPMHLQIVCKGLWEKLPADREQIGSEDVRTFGDVDQALMELYESALREVFRKIPIGQRRLRSWFETQLITPARTRGVVYRGETESEGLPNVAVDILYDVYIIRPAPRGGEIWYELAHDRLVEPILEANRRWREGRQRIAAEPGAVQESASIPSIGSNPFAGPRPYQLGEQLHGRTNEVARLLDLLITERIVLFYSPQGAGKTSLINAGLIPALQAERFRVLPPLRVALELPEELAQQGEAPLSNRYVMSTLLRLEEGLPPEQQTSLAELGRLSLSEYLSRHAPEPGAYDGDVLIYDQFEEILIVDPLDLAAKADFFAQLGQAMGDPTRRLLIAMREEFIAGLDPYIPSLPGGPSVRFRLEPLSAPAALEVIQAGAASAGRVFAPDVAQQLVDELRATRVELGDGTVGKVLAPYVDPLQLQLACRRLWEDLAPEDVEIGVDDLAAVGDLDTALRGYYADTVAAVAAVTGVRELAIRHWLERELISPSGIRGEILLQPEATRGLSNAAIFHLVDSQLVRAVRRRGMTWLELAQDRLIAPVRADNAAYFAAALSPLQRQAALWDEQNRPGGLLLVGTALVEAERWATDHTEELLPHEVDFLEACRAQRRISERERMQNRRIRTLAIAGVIVALVATLLAVFALYSQQAAEQAREAAVRAEGTAQADALRAEINAMRADNARATAQAEKATADAASTAAVQALAALEANLEANLTAQARPSDAAIATPTSTPRATPPDTPTLSVILAGSRTPTPSPTPPGTLTPTSTRSPSPTPNLEVIAQQTQLAEVRATQTRLASPPGPLAFVSDREGGTSRLFRLFAPGSSSEAEQLSLTEAYRPAVDVSARGNIVVFSTADRPEPGGQLVRILAAVDERPAESLIPGDDESRWDPAISPDGSKVLFAAPFGGNQDVFMLNLDGSGLVNLTQSEFDENTPAWSPDGRRIAFSGKRVGGQSDIWVMNSDGSGLERLTDHPNVDTYPAWSPDGAKIAFASTRDDPRNSRPDIYVLDLATREVRNMTNTPLMDENFPAWSRDGAWLAFTRFTTNSEIFVMPSAGGAAINVTNNPADDSYPAWW